MRLKNIIKENKKILNKLIKIVLKPFAMLIPVTYCSRKIIKMAKKYTYNDSEYVGAFIFGYGIRERAKKDEIFSKKIKVEFEKEKFIIPQEYDKYLSNLFGDYMKIPKEEDRIFHYIKARRVRI